MFGVLTMLARRTWSEPEYGCLGGFVSQAAVAIKPPGKRVHVGRAYRVEQMRDGLKKMDTAAVIRAVPGAPGGRRKAPLRSNALQRSAPGQLTEH